MSNAAQAPQLSAEPDLIRKQLDRVLANPQFSQSERLRRFLRFVVEMGLNGEFSRLKERANAAAAYIRIHSDRLLRPIRRKDVGHALIPGKREFSAVQEIVYISFGGYMKNHALIRVELALIIGLLAAIALRPFVSPGISHAQSSQSTRSLYIEPGVTMLRAPDGSRQVLGKVMIDLDTGKVWGLPTTVQQPYPIDTMKSKPPTSVPFLLAKFDFSVLSAQQ
jgi:hypothetical protein